MDLNITEVPKGGFVYENCIRFVFKINIDYIPQKWTTLQKGTYAFQSNENRHYFGRSDFRSLFYLFFINRF